jgi:hypothetical protein
MEAFKQTKKKLSLMFKKKSKKPIMPMNSCTKKISILVLAK